MPGRALDGIVHWPCQGNLRTDLCRKLGATRTSPRDPTGTRSASDTRGITTVPSGELDARRVAVIRCLTEVEQDARLRNMAQTVSGAGATTAVIHLTPETEPFARLDRRGLTWIGIPYAEHLPGVGLAARRRRREWRVFGGGSRRERSASLRRRNLHYAEIVLAKTNHTVTIGNRLTLLRMKVGGRVARVQEKIFRAWWRRSDAIQRRVTFWTSWRRQVPDLYAYEAALGAAVDEWKPDIIHAHDLTALGVATRAARRAKAQGKTVDVVFDAIEDWAGLPHHATITPRYLSAMLKHESEYLDRGTNVITVSNTVADALQKRHSWLPRPAIVMSCPDLREQREAPLPLRDVVGLPADVPTMVYSGGINPARGVDIAIQSLKHLPDWHLVVVTVPFPHVMADELTDMAQELGVRDRFHVAPPVPGVELIDYLSSMDVGLIPLSTKYANLRAAMPNKLFEYLNAGVPVVVSDCPEMRDFVMSNGVGDWFTYPDAAGLAAAVTRTYDRFPKGLIPAQVEELHDRISWEPQGEVLLRTYESLGRS